MNLQLTGYRATGKTSVAKSLSAISGWPWYDTDDLIEQRAGMAIGELFASQGEQAFRDLESEVVADYAGRPDCILALGGGAVLREQNRVALKAGGKAVWLQADVETIRQRMSADERSPTMRPGLTQAGALDEIAAVLADRLPIYEEFSDAQVDTNGRSPEQLARQIWSEFQATG